jgi:hypothetical protein
MEEDQGAAFNASSGRIYRSLWWRRKYSCKSYSIKWGVSRICWSITMWRWSWRTSCRRQRRYRKSIGYYWYYSILWRRRCRFYSKYIFPSLGGGGGTQPDMLHIRDFQQYKWRYNATGSANTGGGGGATGADGRNGIRGQWRFRYSNNALPRSTTSSRRPNYKSRYRYYPYVYSIGRFYLTLKYLYINGKYIR